MAREFKDSGIEWIGQIPKEWEVCRLKNVGYLYGGLTGKASDDFNVGDEDTSYMLYIPFTNIFNNDTINPDQLFKVKIESGEVQNLVQKGDLLFLMSSEDFDGVGKPAIMEEQVENLGLNSFCKGMRVTNSETNSKYLFYLLSSHLLRELVRQEAKGFIRINLRQDRLSCCPVFLPSLTEQQKIADYLDKVCGEVDELVAIQETMIEELKAYKQSVITEAVTKGLNPNIPMKDSGIDWIGQIPAHWKIQRLRTLGWTQNGISQSGDYFGEEYCYPFVSYSDAYKNYSVAYPEGRANSSDNDREKYSLIEGDVLFTRTSETIDEIGFASTCMETIKDAVYSGFLIRFRPTTKKLYKGFSKYYFRSQMHRAFFVKQMNIVTRASLGQDLLKNLIVLLPAYIEQQQIASYLDNKCSEIDSLIAIKQQKIDVLKEYKKSVIYEYVTGKKEVV